MFFKSSCSQVGVQPLELLLWIRTRWASLYKFLDRLLMLRKVPGSLPSYSSRLTEILWQGVDQFVLLADASEKVPNLPKNRTYADFQLSKKDWDRLEVICEVLRARTHFILHQLSANASHRSCQMCNRHSLMSEHPPYGELSHRLNSLSSAGSLWLDNLDTAKSRRRSPRESKASKNGIAKLITLQPHILSVLVRSVIHLRSSPQLV
jgi:hypothetical protein